VNQAHLIAEQAVPAAHGSGRRILDSPVLFDAHQQVLLAGPARDTLPSHRARFHRGPQPDTGWDMVRTPGTPQVRGDLLEALDQLGLAGRGGAHFSVATKWRATLGAGGGGTVVANGAEGEPASAKDAALLLLRPHLVLDGLARAARATGAVRTIVWLHDGAGDVRRSVTAALDERRAARLAEPLARIVTGPDAYLSGESSAVVRALSGGPALPEFRRTPAATSGADGLPTLVHNVETLARIGLISLAGTAGHRDTTMVTVLHDQRRTVLEVDPATTVAAAVSAAAVSAAAVNRGEPPQAVLIGGYGGSWLPWDAAAHLRLEHRALRAAGAGLGAGVLAPLPAQACGLTETAAVVDYLADAGARQCGPCLFGLRAIADLLLDLARGQGSPGHLRRLRLYSGLVAGRGACHHPDGVVRLVGTALATFQDDADEHARRRRCQHPGTGAFLPIPAQPGVASGHGRATGSASVPSDHIPGGRR
jgi:NADH:ubiquinone oxidoreductase subunit F (NADH-binding)